MFKALFEWGSSFGTTKCRTTDISEFQNFEYEMDEKWVIRIFYFGIYFLLLYLLKLFEHLKYMIIYKIRNLRNFDSFPNCKIWIIFRNFPKLNFFLF